LVGLSVTMSVGLTAGAQNRGATPERADGASKNATAVAQKSGVTCRTEYAAMRDGTRLATDIYLPATPGRYPVIMQRTPYGQRLGHGCWASLKPSSTAPSTPRIWSCRSFQA
jgi:predicted acyl esterase